MMANRRNRKKLLLRYPIACARVARVRDCPTVYKYKHVEENSVFEMIFVRMGGTTTATTANAVFGT